MLHNTLDTEMKCVEIYIGLILTIFIIICLNLVWSQNVIYLAILLLCLVMCISDVPSDQSCPIYVDEIRGDQDVLKNQPTFLCSQNYIKPNVSGTSQAGCPQNNSSNASMLYCTKSSALVTSVPSNYQPRIMVSSMAFETRKDHLQNLHQINRTCTQDGDCQRRTEEQMTSSSSHQPELNVIKSFSKDNAPMNVSARESVSFNRKQDGHNVVMKDNTTSQVSTAVSCERPPFTFAVLAAMAIQASPMYRCTYNDIYRFLQRKFPFFRGSYTGWKSSLQGAVSGSKCFIKLPDKKGMKKGRKLCYWSIDQSSQQFQEMQSSGGLRKHVTIGAMSSSLRQGDSQRSMADTSSQNNTKQGQFCSNLVSTNSTAVKPMIVWKTFNHSPPSMVNHQNASLPMNPHGSGSILTSASSQQYNNVQLMNNKKSILGQPFTPKNTLDQAVDNNYFSHLSDTLSDTDSLSQSQNTVTGYHQLQPQQLPVVYSYNGGSYSQWNSTNRCLGNTFENPISSGTEN